MFLTNQWRDSADLEVWTATDSAVSPLAAKQHNTNPYSNHPRNTESAAEHQINWVSSCGRTESMYLVDSVFDAQQLNIHQHSDIQSHHHLLLRTSSDHWPLLSFGVVTTAVSLHHHQYPNHAGIDSELQLKYSQCYHRSTYCRIVVAVVDCWPSFDIHMCRDPPRPGRIHIPFCHNHLANRFRSKPLDRHLRHHRRFR